MNNILELELTTNNLGWACSFAGCAANAKTKITNPKFKISFKSDVPEIIKIAECFDVTSNPIQIKIPQSEEEYQALDKLGATRLAKELELIHSIKDDMHIIQLTMNDMSALILASYGVKSESKSFYPLLTQKSYSKYLDYDAVIVRSSYMDAAKSWFTGYQSDEPNILDLEAEKLSIWDAVCALNSPSIKLFIAHATDPLLFVARSQYKSYANIANIYATLVMYEPNFQFSRFCAPLWGSCLPHNIADLNAAPKGLMRKIQEISNFNVHKYRKMRYNGEMAAKLGVPV